MTLAYSIPQVEQSIPSLPPTGVIDVVGFGSSSSVKKLYSQYPTKLIVPRASRHPLTKVAYIVKYSGSMAQSQVNSLKASVSNGANLVLLTRGPNKVYNNSYNPSAQACEVTIDSNSSCLFLPDPVVCFVDSIYHQHHSFHLKDLTSSLVVLDWYSSGHKVPGEEWELSSYFSNTQITLGNTIISRDLVNLNQSHGKLSDRMTHSNVANVYVIGPQFQSLANSLLEEFTEYQLCPSKFRKNIIWTVTPLEDVTGVLLRITSQDTDPLRIFLRERFSPLSIYLDTSRIFI